MEPIGYQIIHRGDGEDLHSLHRQMSLAKGILTILSIIISRQFFKRPTRMIGDESRLLDIQRTMKMQVYSHLSRFHSSSGSAFVASVFAVFAFVIVLARPELACLVETYIWFFISFFATLVLLVMFMALRYMTTRGALKAVAGDLELDCLQNTNRIRGKNLDEYLEHAYGKTICGKCYWWITNSLIGFLLFVCGAVACAFILLIFSYEYLRAVWYVKL